MRWVKVTEVLISDAGEGKLRVAKGPRILQVEGLTCSVLPGIVPSEISGPGGSPVGIPGAFLVMPGEQILVEHTVQELLYKLTWEGMKIEGPEGVGEDEFIVTETVKRPVPKIEPEAKSNIIGG